MLVVCFSFGPNHPPLAVPKLVVWFSVQCIVEWLGPGTIKAKSWTKGIHHANF